MEIYPDFIKRVHRLEDGAYPASVFTLIMRKRKWQARKAEH
ncbi:MAG: hypothetical protein WCK96_07360 [Methylococcales bacterium]